MYKFSKKSKEKLQSCHWKLQEIMNEVIKHIDCTIVYGHRGEKEQTKLYQQGDSRLKFPKSKHNKLPSLAVDVQPYPFGSKKQDEKFHELAGVIKVVTSLKGFKVEWGYDLWGWDMWHWQLAKGEE